MLHRRDERLSSPARTRAAPNACATRLMPSVELRVKTISRTPPALKYARIFSRAAFVLVGRQLAEEVDAAVHVGVVLAVVAGRWRRAPPAASASSPRCRDRRAACHGPGGAESGNRREPARRRTPVTLRARARRHHPASTSARSLASCAYSSVSSARLERVDLRRDRGSVPRTRGSACRAPRRTSARVRAGRKSRPRRAGRSPPRACTSRRRRRSRAAASC